VKKGQFSWLACTAFGSFWVGQWEDATEMWYLLDPMGRDWGRHAYRPGDAGARYSPLGGV